MTTVSATWLLDPGARTLMTAIRNAGYEIYFVGGCVRNALMGEAVSDIDMATSATPEEMIEIAQSQGLRCVPTGIDHGTLTWVVDDVPYEVTTFRRDVETDGRRATVTFSRSLQDDAQRRDFTINALYCDMDGLVVDPLGGLADLEARRVVFIGNGRERIAEDYLRVLRFFRFHAWYGDDLEGINPDALDACAEAVPHLRKLSRERVGAEIMKLLSAPAPETALGAMDQSGVLNALLAGAQTETLFRLSAMNAPADPILRLAALCDAAATDTLRLSKAKSAEAERRRALASQAVTIAEVAYRHGVDTARAVAFLRAAYFETNPPENLEEHISSAAAQVFPLKAADVLHLASGPALGRLLKDAETHWIAEGFKPTRESLVARAEEGRQDDESHD